MGITGLIPFVKNSTKEVDLRSLRGNVVAVDAYCWLHRGAFSCAEKIVKGEKTDGYVIYCMKYVNLLLDSGVKPILVFDGQRLPSKAETEKKRRESRNTAKQKGKALLAEGKHSDAIKHFQCAVDVTSAMALDLIQACRSVNVDCIVAPYEADAQLAFLSKSGIAQVVITEDSDLIAFGCEKILFKLNLDGRGMLYEKSLLNESLGAKASQFTIDRFRQMCILSGCDYLSSLPGIGLGKSFQFFGKLKPSTEVYSALNLLPNYLKKPGLIVPKEYKSQFEQADNTFLYQLVYDPISRNIVPLTPYPTEKDASHYPYAGQPSTPRKAFHLAVGNLDVNTLEAMDYYDPDDQEANISLRNSYSWSNSVKRASHPSIWRQGYSSQDVFKSPKKTPKKSPRKRLAFTAERTLLTSFLISPGKKRDSDHLAGKPTSEAGMILSQYRSVCEVSETPLAPSPQKPKKLKIESAYSSVEWTPTKIRRKESGSWIAEDEESPIGNKSNPTVGSERKDIKNDFPLAEASLPSTRASVTGVTEKKSKNPFSVTPGQAPQSKRMSYSAISVFEKMRSSRTENNEVVVTSRYFSSASSEPAPNKKRKVDGDKSCFDYLKTSTASTISTSPVSEITASDQNSPSALLNLITPEKSDVSPDWESPVLERTRVSAKKLCFTKEPKSKQANLFKSFAYQKKTNYSANNASVKTRITDEVNYCLDDVVVSSDDERDSCLASSLSKSASIDISAGGDAALTPEKLKKQEVKHTPKNDPSSPVLKRASSSTSKRSVAFTSLSTRKFSSKPGKQMNLFEMFARKK